jgi:methyl-accepting chemotaxis protein
VSDLSEGPGRGSVASKLRAGFGLGLLILIAIGSVSFYDTKRLVEVTAARAQARQFLWDLEQVISNLRGAENEQRGYLLTGDPAHLAAFRKSSETVDKLLGDLVKREPALRDRVAALRPLVAANLTELQHGIDVRDRSGLQAAIADARASHADETMDQIRAAAKSIADAESAVLAQRAAIVTATARRTFLTIGVGTLLALIVLSMASIIIARGITGPVDELVAGAERIGRGELSARIDVRTNDEIADLGAAFNRMAESLDRQSRALTDSGSALTGGISVMTEGSGMLLTRSREQSELAERSSRSLSQVRDGIESIFRSAEKVARLTEDSSSRAIELQASSEEVRASMDHLFDSVSRSTSSTTEMSTASAQMTAMTASLAAAGDEVLSFVAEMEATTAELDKASRSTSDLSRTAREEALAGREAVAETVRSVDLSRELTERASAILGELAGRVAEIGRILRVISEVTEKTNLLALNAAIIAAQAGEQGRGFTVVAGEMRDLAEQTRRSTDEIGSIIAGVQHGSRDAVTAMEESLSRVRDSVSLSRDANASLGRIVASSSSSFEMSEGISLSLAQQAEASRRLYQTAAKMSDAIGESRRSIEEQARAARLLADEAERVHGIAAQVKSASQQQTEAGAGIAAAIAQIDADSRAMRDLLRRQLQEIEQIANASSAMRDIAQQNNTLSQELGETVRSLGQSSQRFESEVSRLRVPR